MNCIRELTLRLAGPEFTGTASAAEFAGAGVRAMQVEDGGMQGRHGIGKRWHWCLEDHALKAGPMASSRTRMTRTETFVDCHVLQAV